MAYGQTGSGKTYTMLGCHSDQSGATDSELIHTSDGIIPRSIAEVFSKMSHGVQKQQSAELSVIEIYNNDIRDLLAEDVNVKHDLVVKADGEMTLPSVVSRSIASLPVAMTLIHSAMSLRCQSATLVHEHSSRSHLIVTVTVVTKTSIARPRKAEPNHRSSKLPRYSSSSIDRRDDIVRTKLQLVDLAGSECVALSGAVGQQMKEATHINRSLSALADVLNALADARPHVPYRNSKLTHLLQDSIGGDAKLLMLLCISPTGQTLAESIQTLYFGQRAGQVQRGQVRRRCSSTQRRTREPCSVFDRLHRPRSSPSKILR